MAGSLAPDSRHCQNRSDAAEFPPSVLPDLIVVRLWLRGRRCLEPRFFRHDNPTRQRAGNSRWRQDGPRRDSSYVFFEEATDGPIFPLR